MRVCVCDCCNGGLLFHYPGTGMHTFPSLAAFPGPVHVHERACLCEPDLCVVVWCVFALTHLELKLSALRNVDINQSHREWCVLEFLHGIISCKHAHVHTNTQCTVNTDTQLYILKYVKYQHELTFQLLLGVRRSR